MVRAFVLFFDVDDATGSDGLSGPLPWSWLRYPSADFCDPDLGSRMKSFRLGFGAIDSSNSGLRTPPQVQILPELGNDGLSGPLLRSS